MTAVLPPHAIDALPSFIAAPRPWLQLYGQLLKPPPAYALQDDSELAPIQRAFTDEMLLAILGRAGPYALGRVACVCRQWRHLTRNPALWQAACLEALSPPAHRDVAPTQLRRVLAGKHGCSWRRMFLATPRVRFDGVYVARNTYIRVGAVELHRSGSTVFLAAYYRYYRFLPNGQLLYRTSPHVLKAVARSLARDPAALAAARAAASGGGVGGGGAAARAAAEDAAHVHVGRYVVSNGEVRTVVVYPNTRGTELRAHLALRETVPGAANRLDVRSLCTYDWETGSTAPFGVDPRADDDDGGGGARDGAERLEHRRGLQPFVFVPWSEVATHPLNLPPSKMDVFLPG